MSEPNHKKHSINNRPQERDEIHEDHVGTMEQQGGDHHPAQLGSELEDHVDQLEKGDLFLVRPGASVPADGNIESGESDVNESMITGESKPVGKEPGDEVNRKSPLILNSQADWMD